MAGFGVHAVKGIAYFRCFRRNPGASLPSSTCVPLLVKVFDARAFDRHDVRESIADHCWRAINRHILMSCSKRRTATNRSAYLGSSGNLPARKSAYQFAGRLPSFGRNFNASNTCAAVALRSISRSSRTVGAVISHQVAACAPTPDRSTTPAKGHTRKEELTQTVPLEKTVGLQKPNVHVLLDD